MKPDLVRDMLIGMSVRSESNSRTRYIASLDFQFRAESVRELLRGYGIPVTDEQAPLVSMLPVAIKDGKVQTGAGDAWRAAWLKLDLVHSLAPMQLLQPDPRLTKETVDAVLAGDNAAFQALRRQYGADRLLIALAVSDTTTGKLRTRLYGGDAAGSIDLVRNDPLDAASPTAVERASIIGLRILESRWKVTHAPGGVDRGGEATISITVGVEFSGMQEWQAIRSRLVQVPGVQQVAVNALTARSATVTFQFADGRERLDEQLATRDLALENRGGAWVLRGN